MNMIRFKENVIKKFSVDGDFCIFAKDGIIYLEYYDSFNDNNSKIEIPLYKHDCKECIFLYILNSYNDNTNTYKDYDIYYCPKGILGGDIVARFSSEGSDYISMPYNMAKTVKHPIFSNVIRDVNFMKEILSLNKE